jgi:hypothetical protein
MQRNAADGALQFFIPRRKAGLFTKPSKITAALPQPAGQVLKSLMIIFLLNHKNSSSCFLVESGITFILK